MFLVVILGTTSGVRAADDADVEALVHQGVELRKEGHNDLALPLLERAYYTAPSGRTAAQLGLVRLALDQWVEAEALLGKSLELGGAWVEKYRSVLEDSLRTARSHIGTLLVKGAPPGAAVVIDGKTVGTLPMASPVEVAEGRCRLLVRAPGFTDFAEDLAVGGQQAQVIEVRLQAPVRTLLESAPPPIESRPPSRIGRPETSSSDARGLTSSAWFWAAVIGGVVGAVAVGIVVEHADTRNPMPTLGKVNGN